MFWYATALKSDRACEMVDKSERSSSHSKRKG